MIELDHLHVPLAGMNLVEASAGTGKTYALACLYLRLVVEQALAPEQILVVTYTEAATEELRGRIRKRLREAVAVCNGAAGDDFLAGLVANANGKGPGPVELRRRLELALAGFDRAAVFTIHGFCLRALRDHAFESGSRYDTELVTDRAPLLREVVDDFWRRSFFGESAPLTGLALRSGLTPAALAAFLDKMPASPDVPVIPCFGPEQADALEEECRRLYAALCSLWQDAGPEIRQLLLEDKGLSRSKEWYGAGLLPPLFAAMEGYVAAGAPWELFDGFGKFTASGIIKGKKPTGTPLTHPFFDVCQSLWDGIGRRLLIVRADCARFGRERLRARRHELNIRHFDDLLTDLHEALRGEQGDELASALASRFGAALIDEFQDTDPVQYAIFRRIFCRGEQPLFLIGDPKQAIYSFRGADIFAYLQAAEEVEPERRHTLTGNFRSVPGLLTALNRLFGVQERPFLFDGIAYRPVHPGQGKETVEEGAALVVWHIPPDAAGKECTTGRAMAEVPDAVASGIIGLRRDGYMVEGRLLEPGDVAVIVRTHRQAALVQEALRARGIPSVMRSDRSVFESDEARQLCAILSALVNPEREARVRAALVTGIFGLNGCDIARLLDDEAQWEEWLERFRSYRSLWRDEGFMVMTRRLMDREGVRGRLLRIPGGERSLTNLLHCCELIHAAGHVQGHGAGIDRAAAWFSDQVNGNVRSGEAEIRLETDDRAVRILTVHVSKGLEFPVVFCPFLWTGLAGDDEVVTYHEGYRLCKDFGSEQWGEHRTSARAEALAEGLRLLYVALTRAQSRCCLVAGKVTGRSGESGPETSPLAYLLHAPPEVATASDPVAALARESAALTAAAMLRQLEDLAGAGEGDMALESLPEPAADDAFHGAGPAGELICRRFSGTIEREWRVTSFTQFSAHDAPAGEVPDRDMPPARAGRDEGYEPAAGIFAFPRGARAGICLHEIFEKLDFAASFYPDGEALVSGCLERHGFAGSWLTTVTGMVEQVLTTPLAAPEGTFTLSGLRQGAWLTELEFYFPLRFITSTRLHDLLVSWSGGSSPVDLAAIGRSLQFRQGSGMVHGFMDMVFEQGGRYYLVDWKSNHLGNGSGDYDRAGMASAMERNLYPLQYLLYTVALDRYLSLRIRGYSYETHFGGVIYVFLRGVDRERGEGFGFFRDLPPAGLIADLTACLVASGEDVP